VDFSCFGYHPDLESRLTIQEKWVLGWLMHSLRKRSFGIIMLLLALVAIAPGLSIVAACCL
jgi:hypothetical protein